jgi:hypothetical protein
VSKSKSRKPNSARANLQRSPAPPGGNQSWLVWVGLAVVGLVAIVAVLAWQTSRSAAPDVASTGGAPKLQVDQTSIDFGDVPVNKQVKASFTLRNAGDQALVISHSPTAELLEGC